MSEETKHSPLLWKTVGTSITGCDGKLITGGLWRVPTDTDLANAEIIVRAVNAHEALVAACGSALGAMNMVTPGLMEQAGIDAWFGAKDKLRAAIKLANGGVA